MKLTRRKALAGIGMGAIAGGAVFGSGAFTFTEAPRDLSVVVADDSDAFLSVKPADVYYDEEGELPDGAYGDGGPNGVYADEEDGLITLNFDENARDPVDGTGINDRAFVNIEDVLVVENKGSQTVGITVNIDGANQAEIGISGNPDDVKPVDELEPSDFDPDNPDTAILDPGDANTIGFFFNLDKDTDFGDVMDDVDTIELIGVTEDQADRFV